MTARRSVLIATGLALGLASLYVALNGADLWDVLHIITQHADWSLTPAFLLAYLGFFWLKSHRWALLLRPFRAVPGNSLLPITVVGYAANVLLPMQLGEVARAYLAANRLNSSTAPLLTSIALERVFDLLAVSVGVALALPSLQGRSPTINLIAYGVAAGAGFGLVMLSFYVWHTRKVIGWARMLLRPLPARISAWVLAQLDKGAQGVEALREGHLLGRIAALSLAMWGLMCVCCLLALHAVDIQSGPAAAFFTLFLSMVGLALPTTPGFIGTIQLAFVLALVPFGVERDEALAASIYYHGLITLPPLLAASGILLSGAVRVKSG